MSQSNYNQYFDIDDLIKRAKKYLKHFDTKRFRSAFNFAESSHLGQIRKDGMTPYIVHPVKVVELLIELHADEDMLISAFLHDVPEDTKHTIREVKQLFGDRVAFLVDGITKLSKVHYKNNMPARQIESLKKMFLHTAKDPTVVIIKLADRLHNMRTLQFIPEESKRRRIAMETLEIYVPIANLLGIQAVKGELEELCFRHLHPNEYKSLSVMIHTQMNDAEKPLKKFERKIKSELKEYGIKAKIKLKKKNLYSIYKKIVGEKKIISDIEARFSFLIIVSDISSCYQMLGILHRNYIPLIKRFKDYIANPKSNGYQSLHTAFFGPTGLLIEVQIRTKDMDFNANFGLAAKLSESNNGTLKKDRRSEWIKKIKQIQTSDNKNDEFIKNLKEDIFEERIRVFTPNGRLIDLPKDATAIDFAYALHSDLGDHAFKAKVNGKLRPMTVVLENRDRVIIIESENYTPKLLWLSFVKTNKAKELVKKYLAKAEKTLKIKEGKELLQKELDISQLGHLQNLNLRKINAYLLTKKTHGFKTKDELLISIGEGELKPSFIINALRKLNSTQSGYRIIIRIVSKDRFGLMADISDILYKYVSDIIFLKGYSSSKTNKNAYFTTKIVINDINSLSMLFAELEHVNGIKHVYRVSKKGVVTTSIIATITVLLWLLHPAIIHRIIKIFGLQSFILLDFLINIFVFLLFILVLYLSHLMKTYFPLIRSRRLFWGVTFALPAIALVSLLGEIFVYNLKLSWVSILIEGFMVYAYLGISFRNFKRLS